MATSIRIQETPDYYDILGVSSDATYRDIQSAYWRAATATNAHRRMAQINEAYEVLGDTRRRAAYDAQRRASSVGPKQEARRMVPGNPGLRERLYGVLE